MSPLKNLDTKGSKQVVMRGTCNILRVSRPTIFYSWLIYKCLKVHEIKNFFGSEFEFCTISLVCLNIKIL
jgi:hypothetical protein